MWFGMGLFFCHTGNYFVGFVSIFDSAHSFEELISSCFWQQWRVQRIEINRTLDAQGRP
jgi:hypothetical protein